MKSINKLFVISVLTILLLQWNIGCTEAQQQEQENQQIPSLDIETIEQVAGMTGTESNGEYKLTVPQNDLNVTVDGFEIIPPMGMGSWAAFTPTESGAVLMGDVVILGNEIGPVNRYLSNMDSKLPVFTITLCVTNPV